MKNLKNLKRIFVIIGIIFCIAIYIFSNPCLAVPAMQDSSISSSTSDDLGLGNLNEYKGTNPNSTKLTEKAGDILGIIQVIGTVVSVAVLVVLGIKYMLGSVEERAEYKQSFGKYILGAFFLFTVTLVPQLVYVIMQNFE